MDDSYGIENSDERMFAPASFGSAKDVPTGATTRIGSKLRRISLLVASTMPDS